MCDPKLDGVDALSTGPHPDRTRYFRAILTDPQIEALQNACAFFLDEDVAPSWRVNPPTDDERAALLAAWGVLSNAAVIVP